jgi:hypothetical protein
LSIITNLLHFGMAVVGLDYSHADQMTLDEITGGSPRSMSKGCPEIHKHAELGQKNGNRDVTMK